MLAHLKVQQNHRKGEKLIIEITFKNRKCFWGYDLVYFVDLVYYRLHKGEDENWRSQNIWLINQLVETYIEENY